MGSNKEGVRPLLTLYGDKGKPVLQCRVIIDKLYSALNKLFTYDPEDKRLNYRSISNPVATEPVTIRYSREIAWIILRLADLGVDVKMLNRLSRVMWFL